jgi:TrmH family RNA methyltransferase
MMSLPRLSQSRLKTLRKLKLRKYRRLQGRYLCEGWRLFTAAAESQPQKIGDIIVTGDFLKSGNRDRFLKISAEYDLPVFQVSVVDMCSLADEITPQGILFTMPVPENPVLSADTHTDSVIVYFEKISDPGNLGTIIRTALWFGVKTIILSPGSVDPYNPKTVRSSSGAVFDTQIYENISFDLLRSLLANRGYRFIGTTPRDGLELSRWVPGPRSVILFGQEASGLSQLLKSATDQQITIPCAGRSESLNLGVSAGIILYHINQHQITQEAGSQ